MPAEDDVTLRSRLGDDLAQARERAYAAVAEVGLDGGHHRTDIALRASRGEIRA